MQHNELVSYKIRLVYAAIFLLALLLIVFCFRWQVVEAERFQEEAALRSGAAKIASIRGTIYARDGTTLAYSEPRYDIYIWLPDLLDKESENLQSREEFVDQVGPLIDKTGEQLDKQIKDMQAINSLYFKVASSVTVDVYQKLMDLRSNLRTDITDPQLRRHLSGLRPSETSVRIYPEGELASQVVGLTKQLEDGRVIGQDGIEGEWGNLDPLNGVISGERDAKGNAIGIAAEKTVKAKRGDSVYTTIDKKLQKIIQDKLKWAVSYYKADGGSVVIEDPKTGQILAMANYPTYDANTRQSSNKNDPNVFTNRAISQPYEIGSVGKIFTLSAAIDLGVVTPNSVILKKGHQGCERITDELEPVCTHDKLPQPAMPIKDAFALSDNIYFLHLAQLMNKQDFYNYLTNYGIGHGVTVDIKGESAGLPLKDWQRWNIADVAAYSYGHAYDATALQTIAGVSAVANHGIYMQPQFVSKIERADGSVVEMKPTALRRVIKKTTANLMDSMMHVIYQNNIFWWEHQYDDLRNYPIAMKSGTALIKSDQGLYYTNDINASYVGYDYSPDRSFVMLVRLERPQGALASQNARVLWLEIFRDIKDYLGIKKIGQF